MLARIKEENAKVSILVTGGFHTDAITEMLRKDRVSYLLIAPAIHHIDDRSNYLNAMTGKRSFMKYFSGSLWDALAKDYTARLVASVPKDDQPRTLKLWRDRVIQSSVAEEKRGW